MIIFFCERKIKHFTSFFILSIGGETFMKFHNTEKVDFEMGFFVSKKKMQKFFGF